MREWRWSKRQESKERYKLKELEESGRGRGWKGRSGRRREEETRQQRVYAENQSYKIQLLPTRENHTSSFHEVKNLYRRALQIAFLGEVRGYPIVVGRSPPDNQIKVAGWKRFQTGALRGHFCVVCVAVCVSARLSGCLSVGFSVRLPTCISMCLSVCLSVRFSVRLSVGLSGRLAVRLSVCLYEGLSVSPSLQASLSVSLCHRVPARPLICQRCLLLQDTTETQEFVWGLVRCVARSLRARDGRSRRRRCRVSRGSGLLMVRAFCSACCGLEVAWHV